MRRRRRPSVGRPERRTAVLAVLALVVALVLAGRLVQVQALDAGGLARAALGNRLVTEVLPAQRGTITDRSGAVLAESVTRFDVTADPSLFHPTAAQPTLWRPARAAAALAPLLGLDPTALTTTLTPHDGSRYAVLAKAVTPAVWGRIAALDVPGIYSARDDQRTYPAGSVAGNLVGWLGSDGMPGGGLEYADNALLKGHDGTLTYERGERGERIPTGEDDQVAVRDGTDLRLTTDEDLQYYAQQVITAQVAATRAQWGSVVVMTKDQQVLAMAESDALDPTDPGATPAADRGDRAIDDVVEPGSTGKVATAAALIQDGLATPSTQLVVPNSLRIPGAGKPFVDAEDHGTEHLTFAGVIAESSNIGTVMLGRQLTKAQRYDNLRAFGLGSTALGLPGETGGILAEPQDWDGRTQYTVLFGQGYGVSVLQQCSVYATIANGGVRVRPHVIAGTTSADGTYTPAREGAGTRVVSASTARQVVSMLEGAVGADGTGTNANVPGFRVAGKTGTADDLSYEAAHHGQKAYTSSFIGMAPAEDPQIIVAVTLQHPQTDHFGGTVAAPVFSQVMAHALAEQHVAPSTTAPSLTPLTW